MQPGATINASKVECPTLPMASMEQIQSGSAVFPMEFDDGNRFQN
jgi:hypothetical protein